MRNDVHGSKAKSTWEGFLFPRVGFIKAWNTGKRPLPGLGCGGQGEWGVDVGAQNLGPRPGPAGQETLSPPSPR